MGRRPWQRRHDPVVARNVAAVRGADRARRAGPRPQADFVDEAWATRWPTPMRFSGLLARWRLVVVRAKRGSRPDQGGQSAHGGDRASAATAPPR